MTTDPLLDRPALLSTGDRVPLRRAATCLVLLNGLLVGGPADRQVVADLRQACLENAAAPPDVRTRLASSGLVVSDGTIDPDLRRVVLAAIGGNAEAVSLHSPYTHPVDRALSDLMTAHATLQMVLPADALAGLLATLDGEVELWSQRFRNRPGGPDNLPPSRN